MYFNIVVNVSFVCGKQNKLKMPPKPQVFKTPDGKEFATRKEWREYMLSVFYSFKNKQDETAPLIKLPGEIDGQAFERKGPYLHYTDSVYLWLSYFYIL